MKFPVFGAELTMQDSGTTLVEGPIRRTMETEEMPAVGWKEGGMSVYVGGVFWASEDGRLGTHTSQVIVNGLSTGTIWF